MGETILKGPYIKEVHMTIMGKIITIDVAGEEYHFPYSSLTYYRYKPLWRDRFEVEICIGQKVINFVVIEWPPYRPDEDCWSVLNSFKEALAMNQDDISCNLVLDPSTHGLSAGLTTEEIKIIADMREAST